MSSFFYRQLAKASNNGAVSPGQEVTLKVDLVLAHDGSGPEILRIFNRAFDEWGDPTIDLAPAELQGEIDQINERTYSDVNNGV